MANQVTTTMETSDLIPQIKGMRPEQTLWEILRLLWELRALAPDPKLDRIEIRCLHLMLLHCPQSTLDGKQIQLLLARSRDLAPLLRRDPTLSQFHQG